MSMTIVEFLLGPHHCALPIDKVQEILRIVAVTPLPSAPPFVEGVINLRGSVIPVIDMRKRLGFDFGPYDSQTRIMIAPLRGHPTGLIVDEVTRVDGIPDADMGINPSEHLGMDVSYTSRVVTVGGQIVVVLDLDKILTEEEGRHFDETVKIHGK